MLRANRAAVRVGLGLCALLGCADEDGEEIGMDESSASRCDVPGTAEAERFTRPTTVVGSGTPASCTSEAFVAAVAKGGVITFNCGTRPHTIKLKQTAKVFNNRGPKVVIDGGNRITLSGDNKVRILYQNTCDGAQVWTTAQCDNQDHPQLTVQNLTFVNGNAKNTAQRSGGAIFAQGGRLKVVNSRFYGNVCADTGPDVGGGAIRVLQQYQGRPAQIINSTFGAEGKGNVCANGGAISSIGVSFDVINSTFRFNRATGHGANPAQAGTPGGGSGGAIYNDGNAMALNLCGVTMTNNSAKEGGGGIFFVSNNRTGSVSIRESTLSSNRSGKFETAPGIYVEARGAPVIERSAIAK